MLSQRVYSTTLAVLALTLAGCATQGNKDPLEGLNRSMSQFNHVADNVVLKPVAGAYKAVVPTPLRGGVNNFFSNLGDFVTMINDLLQFKFDKAMSDGGRFVINSTFGVAGVFDWASKDGIEKRREDFGQTLAAWGWRDSSYLVLPILGPSTVRDTGGAVVDGLAFEPINYLDPRPRNILTVTKIVDRRAQYLPGSDLLDEAALDPYIFMRDAYMQRRESQIMDGDTAKPDDSSDNDMEPTDKVAEAAK